MLSMPAAWELLLPRLMTLLLVMQASGLHTKTSTRKHAQPGVCALGATVSED